MTSVCQHDQKTKKGCCKYMQCPEYCYMNCQCCKEWCVMACPMCLTAYLGNKKSSNKQRHFNRWCHIFRDPNIKITKSDKKYLDYYMVDNVMNWCSASDDWNFDIRSYKIQLSDIQSDLIRDLEYDAHDQSKSIYNKKQKYRKNKANT